MPTVLLTAPYMILVKDRFIPVFKHYGLEIIVPEVHERLNEQELIFYAGKFDGTICGDDDYSSKVLDECTPRLKVISKWGTGIDSIDKLYAESKGVIILNTTNAFTLPVADSVMGYVLAFARRQPWLDKAIKNGQWEKLPGKSLSECTMGVIGVGNIGKAVLRRARGFEMKLLGNDIVPIAEDFVLENNVEMIDLKPLLANSDFVSINCTLNPTSYHLINEESLSWLKPGAVIINTARGPIIEELELIRALVNHTVSGAALDVFEKEPLPKDSPLMKMENVMLAPHNSNSSPSAWERVHWNTIRNLLSGLKISIEDFESIKTKY